MSTTGTDRRGRWPASEVIRVLVTVVLGGIGAAAGFKHTHDWAIAHGQTGWLAWADAVVIEGMAVVSGFEIHREHHQSSGPRRRVSFPAVVLVAGFAVQMAAQVALAEPTPAGWLLAAMPALGFLVVVKLLMRRTVAPSTTASPASDTAPASDDSDSADPVEPATDSGPPAPAIGESSQSSSPGSRLRLGPGMTDAVTRAVEEVRAEGREPTTEDIRRAVRVSDSLAEQILADLPARNGHPLTTS